MTTFTDAFARTSSDSLGSDWTALQDTLTGWGCDGAKGTRASTGAGVRKSVYYNGASIAVSWPQLRLKANASTAAVLARAATGTIRFYMAYVTGSPISTAYIFYFDGTTYNNLTSGSVSFAADDILGLKCNGTTLTVTKNGVDTAVTTTHATLTSGYAGIFRDQNASGTFEFDDFQLTDYVAAPTAGTLYASGTHASVACGPRKNGDIVLVYSEAGSGPETTSLTVELSADGSTFADATARSKITNLGSGNWKIILRRPNVGSQAVAFGATATIRVKPANLVGTGSATSNVTATPALDKTAIGLARASLLHTLQAAQSGGVWAATFYGEGTTGEKYPAQHVLSDTLSYLKKTAAGDSAGAASAKADAIAQFNYIKANCINTDLLFVHPDEPGWIGRDSHMRNIYFVALAARLMRNLDPTTAATWITEADKWAKAWFDKLNNGTGPVASADAALTRHGWDANNASGTTGNVAWQASHAYVVGDVRKPTSSNSRLYRCVQAGTSGGSEPTWPTSVGAADVTDGTAKWRIMSYTGGMTAGLYVNSDSPNGKTARANSTAYDVATVVRPASANGHCYVATVAGISAGSPPTWPTTAGATVTDGGVTWKEASGYIGASAANIDLNQVTEEMAALALLCDDADSAFHTAGTYRTKAAARLTDIAGFTLTYQVSGGKIPIGDPIPPADGREMYDSIYGGFSITTIGCAYSVGASLLPTDLLWYVDAAIAWFSGAFRSEPPHAYAHYTGSTSVSLPENEFPHAAFALRAVSDPLADTPFGCAFNDPDTDKWGNYNADGAVTATIDAWQARFFLGEALATAALATFAPTGLASETDTGLGATVTQATQAGLAGETDTGFGVSASQTSPLGQPEGGLAFLFPVTSQTITIGVGTETDSGLGATPRPDQFVTAGLGTETDTGLDVTPVAPADQAVTVGLPVEVDEGLSIAGRAIGVGVITLNMQMPPGTVVGAYLTHEWRGHLVPIRRAGSYPGPVQEEQAVDAYGEVTFASLPPGEYVAWAEDYPLRRRFFMVES